MRKCSYISLKKILEKIYKKETKTKTLMLKSICNFLVGWEKMIYKLNGGNKFPTFVIDRQTKMIFSYGGKKILKVNLDYSFWYIFNKKHLFVLTLKHF